MSPIIGIIIWLVISCLWYKFNILLRNVTLLEYEKPTFVEKMCLFVVGLLQGFCTIIIIKGFIVLFSMINWKLFLKDFFTLGGF